MQEVWGRSLPALQDRVQSSSTAPAHALVSMYYKVLYSLSRPTDHTDGSEPKKPKRMTRVERGRMEALQSFGGSNLRDTLDTSKKRVAQTLEAKRDKPAEEESGEDQDKENNDNVCM